MAEPFFSHESTKKIRRLKELKPELFKAFMEFDHQVFADGAIDRKTKEMIALAIAHITQCPWCIDAHTRRAKQQGVSDEQLAEVTYVAMAMASGAAFSHSAIMFTSAEEAEKR
jgi:AhpD family alkylhydroperoxidase